MNLLIYNDPQGQAWDITGYIPQDSLSLLQTELEGGLLRAALSLELYNSDPDTDFLSRIRRPGILVISSGVSWLFALYYDPVKTQYDPTTRRYRLNFVSLLEALKAYLDREHWWNVLDAASLMATLKAFLAQYLPQVLLNKTAWLPDSMSPLQEDPANTDWPYFTGFIQPASWLVGKQVDYGINGPWTIISVLGVAKSLTQANTIFALCLAKPAPWWSNEGDYVLPIVIKATWNQTTWDWDIGGMIWHLDQQSEINTWWWPVWFGLRQHLPGQTGESSLIYTTYTTYGERVVVAWAESPVRKPRVQADPDEGFYYVYWPKLRLVLLDGNLNLLDQERLDFISLGAAISVPETLILRGGGNANGQGVVFVGINGLACKLGQEIGTNGQDGYVAVLAQRWNNHTWTDEAPNTIEFGSWHGGLSIYDPYRLIGLEAFFNGSENDSAWELHRIYGHNLNDGGNLNLRELIYQVGTYLFSDNSLTPIAAHQWRLQFRNEIKPTPCFAVPYGPLYYNGSAYEGGFVFGYTLLEYGEGTIINPDGIFVDCVGGELTSGITDYSVNPHNAGYMELDIRIDAGGEERYDGAKAGAGWTENQIAQNQAGQLRTLIATRMRPFAIRYETQGNTRRVKFLILHQSFSEWEAFAISGEYDPSTNQATIFTMDGRSLRGEVVPKVGGGSFNESDAWRSVVVHGTLYANTGDPRSSGYDHQGNYGVFSQPVGVMSVPVVKKVCENENIYSEPGKLSYQNMMNSDYRYWMNIYNAHRGHIITPLAWWSFTQTELDYREKSNIALIEESWDRAVHGLSYVAGRFNIGGVQANRICLVLVPRWPLKGDTHTISGQAYWETNKPYSALSEITERQFSLDLMGTYWDALVLGPEGGAILTNIWWDEEGQMNRELLVALKELYPQWFGAAQHRGNLYTELLEYLREHVYPGSRVGLRGLDLPVYAWLGIVPIGAIIPYNLMADLEARRDPELVRFRNTENEPIPLYWQVVGLKWDLTRNRALFSVKEIRDKEWKRR